VTSRTLAAHVGGVLRRERERAGRTQHQVAAAAGTSQSAVARIERGTRAASLSTVERLFAALDRQVRLTVERLDSDLDAEIDRLAAEPMTARLAGCGVPTMVRSLSAAGLAHVVEGAAAAVLQGVPVPVDAIDAALLWSQADELVSWFDRHWAYRWNAHWGAWGHVAVDPRVRGAHEWRVVLDDGLWRLRGRFADALPEAIEVRADDLDYLVRPLVDVEVVDVQAARLLDRYRRRSAQSPP